MKMTRLHLLLLIAPLVLVGCLFDTRDPLPPDTQGGPAVSLDQPFKVFEAMQTSLTALQTGDYERAISDNYLFSPLIEDSLDQNFVGTGVFDGFDKSAEDEVVNLLVSDADTVEVQFNPAILVNENTFVRYRVEYDLRTVARGTGAEARYRGVAHFDVRNEGGVWRLEFWDEIEPVEGFTSWGFLKGELRQRLEP